VAINEGRAFADTQFGRMSNVCYENVPSAVFSTPETGYGGAATEAEAQRCRDGEGLSLPS